MQIAECRLKTSHPEVTTSTERLSMEAHPSSLMPPTPAETRQRTKQFAVRVINMTEALPGKPAARVITNQILRSATSIGANYHSACKARTRAEFIAKIGVVAEEADETVFWLELLVEAGFVKAKRMEALLKEANELVSIFVSSQITARARH